MFKVLRPIVFHAVTSLVRPAPLGISRVNASSFFHHPNHVRSFHASWSCLAAKGSKKPKNSTENFLQQAEPVVKKKKGRKKKDTQDSSEDSFAPTLDGEIKMKVLNVAEKNDAAKNIARILSNGNSQMRNGLAPYNKVYEFQLNIPRFGGNVQMSFTSVSGHLQNYDFTSAHRSWSSCDPIELFDAPLIKKVPVDYYKVRDNILNCARTADALIIWTDCDREGENIGYEVINIVTAHKPGIQVYRAKFSEITPVSIRRAIANLTQPDKKVSDAVDVRQQLDLRIGAAFTRLQTLSLQKELPSSSQTIQSIISFGTCQFPTLTLIVERYLERESFIIKPFWYIEVTHKRGELNVTFKWQRNRLFDIHQCLSYYMNVMTEPIVATVTSVVTKPKSKWRPLPMDTVLFEKLASSKLRIPAKQAMKIAEKLYTSGWISYPRTETNIFPKELDLQPIVQSQVNSGTWGPFAQTVLEKGINPRQGKNSDHAHPPIYPTKFTSTLSGDESRIYELIARHFLACVSADAKGVETEIKIEINGEFFNTSGLIVLERNYLEVYPYEKWTGNEIPNFVENETFTPDSIMMQEGKTTPPSLLTESDLITAMEKHGIGTDATHAEHIETIKDRNYVTLTNDRRFLPLPLGLGLVMGYKKIKDEVAKPQLRALMEKDIQEICTGTKQPMNVLTAQIRQYKDVFNQVISQCNLLCNEVKETFVKYPHGCSTREDPPSDDEGPPGGPAPRPGPGNGPGPGPDDGHGGQGGGFGDGGDAGDFLSVSPTRPRGKGSRGGRGSYRARGASSSRGSTRGTRGRRGAGASRSSYFNNGSRKTSSRGWKKSNNWGNNYQQVNNQVVSDFS